MQQYAYTASGLYIQSTGHMHDPHIIHTAGRKKMYQTCTHSQPRANINILVVSKFFTVSENDKKFTICITCKARVNRGGITATNFRTTNLIRH